MRSKKKRLMNVNPKAFPASSNAFEIKYFLIYINFYD